MRLHTSFYIFIFLTFSHFVVGQIPQKWYFGQYAGIDFGVGLNPISFTGSKMSTPAGCAVSPNGQFYSNGVNVWDINGLVTGAVGLNGNILSTQSVVMVDMTESDSILIFTTDAKGGSKGFNMHILYPNQSSGAYSMVAKNFKLIDYTAEKVAVAQHCNRNGYWVITHGWNDNKFYAFLVDKNSVDTIPVVTSIGSTYSGNVLNAAGYMKVSAQSDKIASVITGMGRVELFKFDFLNGSLSSPIVIDNLPDAYGVEFDLTGNVLYVSSLSGKIYQFNLANWSQSLINSSKYVVVNDVALFGALQRASDGRIYLSKDNSTYLSAIKFPQTMGSGCSFIPNEIYLNGARCEAGLPPIYQAHQLFDVKGFKDCIGDTSQFSILGDTTRLDSVFWYFGDTLSLTDTSSLFSPTYVYPKRGVYKFKVILYHCNQADTFENYAEIFGPPYANLGPDTSICDNSDWQLFGGYADEYLWHDGATTQLHSIIDTGLYWVRLKNSCGIKYDSVFIKEIFKSPVFALPNDTTLCLYDSLTLYSPFDTTFLSIWNDTIYSQKFTVTGPSMPFLTVVDSNNCRWRDQILVQFDPFPMPNLGVDTFICYGKSITFNGNFPGSYLWSDGSHNQDLTTYSSGIYIVTVSNACGTNSDTINLEVLPCEQVIWVPNAFTPNGDAINDVFLPYVENVNDYQLQIFDRWGLLLFETKNSQQGWDGRVDGKLLPIGAYVWKMKFRDYYQREYEKYGFVVLLR